MFTYLAINCCKCTSSRAFLNSQEQYLQKKNMFFSQILTVEPVFSLQFGFQLLPEGKWVSHQKLDKDPSACLHIKNSVLFP